MLEEEPGLSERQQYWLEWVRECEESGLTTKAYAEAHALSTSALYAWRKRLSQRGLWPSQAGRFDRIQVSTLTRSSSEWRITLPNGVQVEFCGSVDGAQVSQVLAAVKGIR
jgi:transposase-like protein